MVGFLFCFKWAFSQCLTDFSKLTPETTTDYTVDFGRSLSMHNEFLAVGVPSSDSIGRVTGLVYIYKKTGTKWIKNSAIVPAIPLDGLQFGYSVKISEDYLFVGALAQGGSVYVFRKNGTDWSNVSELAIWKVPDAQLFGVWNSYPIAITPDQNTIAITDIWHRDKSFPHESTGAIYVYYKSASQEWSSSISPQLIPPPEVDVDDFGRGGVLFQGNRMATFTPFAPTAIGRIYIYRDDNGAFDNPQLEAKLSVGDLNYSYGFGINNFAFTPDGIFLMASVDRSTPKPKWEVAFFEQPPVGAWSNGNLTCHFDPDVGADTTTWSEPNLFASSGDNLIFSSRDRNNKGTLTYFKKGASGWCDPLREIIEENLPDPSTTQRYGLVLAANESLDIVIGYVSHPTTGVTQVALKTFARNGSGWEPNYLSTTKKSTAGHYYGHRILGKGDNLFVSAPGDGTVKATAGAVYIYTKNGSTWAKTGKILPPAGGQNDDVFGSDMATNGDYLTVAAVGHSPSGKFFVYKKGADWNTTQLVQEINLRTAGLTVHISGDNIAMSQDWLVMPYINSGSSPSHILLAIYKFTGTNFQFHQSLYIKNTDFFARSSTVAVSIEGNLIVAGTSIVELDGAGVWEVKYQLYPSDPEPIQIARDFSYWVSNGSKFGYSNYISNSNTIFISAPTKDYEGIWDVGAVYVFTKRPNEAWSSRVESAKIVPHVKEESGLFGYSLAALENTLIVGSPLNDFYRTGQSINKPGLASVFQAQDYHWKTTNWIADFTGDSFVKDYFGMALHLDQTDFFMGAPIEDLETGKLSGSVYMVPTPPIVKLVPPICLSEGTENFDLFGYPFEGSWSGTGIVDTKRGTFSPTVAGAGLFTIKYQTPYCANTGILQVEVQDNPIPVLNAQELLVCQNATSIAIAIGVEPLPEIRYLWYYRTNSIGAFQSQGNTNSSIVATKRGEYQVKATDGTCSSFSPIITIKNENVELALQDLSPTCNTSTVAVPLQATPTGGLWSGNGISNGSFVPQNKPPGIYPLTYSYTSKINCTYSKAITAQVVAPFAPVLAKAGNICIDGKATISLTSAPASPTSIQWFEKNSDEPNYSRIQNGGNSIVTNRNGSVKVITETTYCSPKEAVATIQDTFTASISPDETNLEFCPGTEYLLTASSSLTGATLKWNYYEQSAFEAVILNNTDLRLRPESSGYYFATLYSGACMAKTPVKHVQILPADTVFIPNVFTPNGDGKNDKFTIVTNDPSPTFEVFNRYGQQIYHSHGNLGWDGENTPTGVYFWYASVANCIGERSVYKGTVHLVR